MSRMLQALKRLEEKQQSQPETSAAEKPATSPQLSRVESASDVAEQSTSEIAPPSATFFQAMQMSPVARDAKLEPLSTTYSVEPSFTSIDSLLLEAQDDYHSAASVVPPISVAETLEQHETPSAPVEPEVAPSVSVPPPAAVAVTDEVVATPEPVLPLPAPQPLLSTPPVAAAVSPLARLLEPASVAQHTPIDPSISTIWQPSPSTFSSRPAAEATPFELACQSILNDRDLSQPIRTMTRRLLDDLQVGPRQVALLVGVGAASDTTQSALLLAMSLAAQLGDVLIVDADPVRQKLTVELKAEGGAGVSDVLLRKEAEHRASRKLQTPGLTAMGTGSALATPADAPDDWAELSAHWRSTYRLVLLCGGRASDDAAIAWSRAADATYVAIKLGAVEAAAAQADIARLQSAGARVLGCIAIE